MYDDLSTVYDDTLYIIHHTGLVYSLPTDMTGDWKKVAELGNLPKRQVFPAPIVKKSDIKC